MSSPIFCVSAGRSGTSMVLQLLNICGAFIGTVGKNSKYCENLAILSNVVYPYLNNVHIKKSWREQIIIQLQADGYLGGSWAIKGIYFNQLWPIWKKAFPEAKWIIVRRRTGDIISSYMKTNYLTINPKKFNVNTEQEAWLCLVHQYEESFVELINSGVDYRIVWPERMAYHDYNAIKETVDWAGLTWTDKAFNFIDPKFEKTRLKENIRRIV
jgi:hypothetical protein